MNKPRSKAEYRVRFLDSELSECTPLKSSAHKFSRRRINKITRAQGKREINDGLAEAQFPISQHVFGK